MTHFLYLITFLICFNSISQEDKVNAITKGKTELLQNKKDGHFSFALSKNISLEEIEKKSSYYSTSFSVEYNSKKNELIVLMKINDEKNRHILIRFLTSIRVDEINSDNKSYKLQEFYDNFLK